jgi:NADPH:quinone reductase-like Zn-dependent oxidoreductase
MLAVYADKGDQKNPLAGLRVGEAPNPAIPEGWVRVKISHASLNRHDIFTLMGITAMPEGLAFPIILGNDGAGKLDDGTEIGIYPIVNQPDFINNELMDPKIRLFSENIPGTFAEYVAVPKRNAIPLPKGLSAQDASVLGTAWLTAYRMLFTKSNLKPGQTMLVQGAGGGMSTALIQMGKAAGFEVWATGQSDASREVSVKVGADKVFKVNERLPKQVAAVFDNVGPATLEHSIQSTQKGGTIVVAGITTGMHINLNILPIFINELRIVGAIMGTFEEMKSMMNFIVTAGIKPEVGTLLPMQKAEEGIRLMHEGKSKGKIVFTVA